MICFVFSRVDGVLRGPRSVLLSLLGLVDGAPAQGWGGALARRSARAASPPFAPCFAHTCGAELFHQPPKPAPFHQTARNSELV